MKSVGELLQKERERRRLSITQVSAALCIQEEYIRSLEENAFEALPSSVAAQGYVSSLSSYYGLKPESMIALMRRDFSHVQEMAYPLAVVSRQRLKRRKAVTSFLTSIIAIILITSMGYGFWMYQRVRQAPSLTVLTPEEGEKVVSPVLVRGRTASDAVVELDTQAIAVSQDGEFISQLELSPGEHVITISSKNRYGKDTTVQVLVKVESK